MPDTTPQTPLTITDARGVELRLTASQCLLDPAEITVELNDLIGLDLERFLDLISERAGFPLLMQQDYRISGVNLDQQTLTLAILGDVSMELEHRQDDD